MSLLAAYYIFQIHTLSYLYRILYRYKTYGSCRENSAAGYLTFIGSTIEYSEGESLKQSRDSVRAVINVTTGTFIKSDAYTPYA